MKHFFAFIFLGIFTSSKSVLAQHTKEPYVIDLEQLSKIFHPSDSINVFQEITKNSDLINVTQQYRTYENNDIHLNITQLIEKNGYSVEEREVITTDGYILSIFRIPSEGPPVLLMHGLACSAVDWIINGPGASLAYLLADAGYDVWLGNTRGNIYAKRHISLSNESAEFWDFTWDEMGRYDLPNTIDYVLNVSSQSQLKYIGHSQGTTAFFIMCSERPEYNDKVSIMIAMSAVAWMSNMKSPIFRAFGSLAEPLYFALQAFNIYDLPRNTRFDTLLNTYCGTPILATTICTTLMFALVGFDYPQVNITNAPVIFGHYPEGTGTKAVLHYSQEMESGKFRNFDYGFTKNLARYGSYNPPEYVMQNVKVPVAIFYADNDWISNFADVKILIKRLSNVVGVYRIPLDKFNHMDYLFAKDVKELVNDKVLQVLDANPVKVMSDREKNIL